MFTCYKILLQSNVFIDYVSTEVGMDSFENSYFLISWRE